MTAAGIQAGRGDDVLVRARNLGKKYRIYGSPRNRLLEWCALGRVKLHRDFWALRGVSFELKRGDKLGVLGMNGAGKSTLLGLVAGVLTPDAGSVEHRGDVAALLDLTAGFHQDFTGRENIFLAGHLRGLTRARMKECLDDIIQFAEIGEFIDQPVRTYSSGMLMRLAFSVATMVTPDVLIIDEVMSVGDVFFQHKCMRRIEELTSGGTVFIFVTHATDQVRTMCNLGLVLDGGEPIFMGDSERAADVYLKEIREREAAAAAAESRSALATAAGAGDTAEVHKPEGFPPAHAFAYGPADVAEIVNVEVVDEGGAPASSFRINDHVSLRIYAYVKSEVENLGAAFLVRDSSGVDLVGTTSHHYGYTLERPKAGRTLVFTFTFPNVLREGHYSLIASVNRLEVGGDIKSAVVVHQLDNVAGYQSTGLPDLHVYHRAYVPVTVQVGPPES